MPGCDARPGILRGRGRSGRRQNSSKHAQPVAVHDLFDVGIGNSLVDANVESFDAGEGLAPDVTAQDVALFSNRQ
jgi:hypothetical protein